MSDELTQLLNRVAGGDRDAEDELMRRVYDRLRVIAGRQHRSERDSVPPTALVHEAFIRLFRTPRSEWSGRDHFFGTAAQAMRQIAVDHARRRTAHKRGGGWGRVTVSGLLVDSDNDLDLLALDDALRELGHLSERQVRIVELRFFVGLSSDEIAELLQLSTRTVQLEWRTARAWLQARLVGDG